MGETSSVPFTKKSFLLIALGLMVLTAPLWWDSQSKVPAHPDLSGKWIGTAKIDKDIKGIGKEIPVNKTATISLTLTLYDSFLGYYRGDGVLKVEGEAPRFFHVPQISLGEFFDETDASAAGGGSRLSGTLDGDFETAPKHSLNQVDYVQGSAQNVTFRFHTVSVIFGYQFEAEMHR
jgi:hypothetical protein